ncbi:MAG TPA: cytochrome d ubiquinol oxidase subunit II [Acidimicrobiales bacterium]|nr:cytochrome d ubiquinol oxidase subunit II [Acidimicrobiales bacterium]
MTVDLVAALLWAVVTTYAVTGGADFGGGIWDLFAGGTKQGATVRGFIERSIGPIWEANHVWLVIVLVVLWTGFPQAFGAIMSTLFVPLSIAVFGIILRGSGFAFRQSVHSLSYMRFWGALFALSSLLTPFFFGAAAGAVVTGKVPASGEGNRITSWTTSSALTLGFLSVAAFAYLAAVYLTHEARRRSPDLVGYFARRALVSGLVVGALAGLALYELETSAPRVASRLTAGAALPLLVISLLLGGAVLFGLSTKWTGPLRYLAAGAFAAMLWGWAVAQYPAMLPGSLSLAAAAAPTASLVTEVVVVGVIVAVVVPSFLLLYRLSQRGALAEGETTERLLAQLGAESPAVGEHGPTSRDQ